VVVEDEGPGHPGPLTVEFWAKWDLDAPTDLGLLITVDMPLPRMVQANMGIDFPGALLLTAVVKEAGAPTGMAAGVASGQFLMHVLQA